MAAPGLRNAERFVAVALPLPTPEPYTYRLPQELDARALPGARVVVPLGRRELVGVVVGRDVAPPDQPAKPVYACPDPEPALTPALLRLGTWMAGYYGAPLGLALKSVLPGALWGASRCVVRLVGADGWPAGQRAARLLARLARGGSASTAALQRALGQVPYDLVNRLTERGLVRLEVEPPPQRAERTERVVRLVGEPLTLAERDGLFRRAPSRRRAYEVLEALGGSASTRHLVTHHGLGSRTIRGLVASGLADVARVTSERDPFAALEPSPAPANLTAHQGEVLRVLESSSRDRVVVLQGVTGSGKTLVYLELVRREVEQGRGAIVLVPEIALTPQTVARVRGVFGDQVAVLHSALSEGERIDAWWRLRRGARRVAIGARSAVFAPLPRLGAIVVDEEHEATYKQAEAPRYHARDVARVRARLEDARLILGSATPSLESWDAARRGEAVRVVLPERIEARPLPPVELVDLTRASLAARGPVAWSESLDAAVCTALERGEQVLLLLNRRGFAAFLQCPRCGVVAECPHCSIALTVHRTPPGLRCHYCGHLAPVPDGCPRCGAAVQRMKSPGTQQLERFVTDRFPLARVARMDLDTTGTRWAHHRILERVARAEVDILVGTQMIAKGLDFPAVTVVGVVDADVALHLPDFRAAERTFALVAQVAGRTGRGPRGGRVVVQTRSPEHYALRCAAAHAVDAFLARELEERRAPPYPPHVALLRVLVEAREATAAARGADAVAGWIRTLDERHLGGQLVVLGPAPAPLPRLRDWWRWHVLVKAFEPRTLGRVVRTWARRRERGRRDLRVALDRDPASLL